MRGRRAKQLKRYALTRPASLNTGFYDGTFVRGGVQRTYRDLKKRWRQRLLAQSAVR